MPVQILAEIADCAAIRQSNAYQHLDRSGFAGTIGPEPAPDEVLVAVQACGICGSDVHAAEANTTRSGGIPGHEFSGTIARLGADVSGWREGQAVAVNPLGSCGTCEPCHHGIPIRCL